jgi:preflagellin peptidase FlaK
MLIFGSVFVFYEILIGKIPYLKALFLSGIIVFCSVYILFQLGVIGGGDAKGLIVLSIFFPFYPIIHFSGATYPLLGLPMIGLFTFTVLENAILMTTIVPLGLFCYNLLHFSPEMLKKPFYMFIGYIIDIYSMENNKHLSLLEKFEVGERGDIKKKFVWTRLGFDSDYKPEIEEYMKKELIKKEAWVTPSIPFMLSITAGFIIAVVFGDLVYYIITSILVS